MIKQIQFMLKKYRENGGNCRESVFEECGHAPHFEKEKRFLEELVNFLNGVREEIGSCG